jgi:hypothetical protein
MLIMAMELNEKRHLEQKAHADIFKGGVPPNVNLVMKKKLKAFVKFHPDVDWKFVDQQRTRAKLSFKTSANKKVTRKVHLVPPIGFGGDPDWSDGDLSCDCSGPEVTESACGWMLYAAEKKGLSFSSLLSSHHEVTTWKCQYQGLTPFALPGTGTLRSVEGDGSSLQEPVALPQKADMPPKSRRKGAVEYIKAKIKKNEFNQSTNRTESKWWQTRNKKAKARSWPPK